MSTGETPPSPFDPEKFRADFVDCLTPGKPVETPIQMMNEVLRANPDRTDEICRIASEVFRAAAINLQSPGR